MKVIEQVYNYRGGGQPATLSNDTGFKAKHLDIYHKYNFTVDFITWNSPKIDY